MPNTIVPMLHGLAQAKNTNYEATPSGVLVFLNYKSSTDKTTKVVTPAASAFVACVPALALPTTGSVNLDKILASAMEGYAESLVRSLRATEGNPDSLEIGLDLAEGETAEGAWLDAVIQHAEEKASSLKLSEQAIGAWFKAEGEDAVRAQYMAANNIGTEDTPANVAKHAQVVKAVASMGILFAKLAAPTPDISPEIAGILLTRLSVIDTPSSTTQAIRYKLQQRVDMAKKAADLLTAI